jgi:hypothetical protein
MQVTGPVQKRISEIHEDLGSLIQLFSRAIAGQFSKFVPIRFLLSVSVFVRITSVLIAGRAKSPLLFEHFETFQASSRNFDKAYPV